MRAERFTGTGIIGYILGLNRDNGKEHGNYYSIIGYILGLHRDNGKVNGNYHSIGLPNHDWHLPKVVAKLCIDHQHIEIPIQQLLMPQLPLVTGSY